MNKHFNKHLLSTISVIALLAAASPVYAVCPGPQGTGAGLNCLAGTQAQVQDDYETAYDMFLATGLVPKGYTDYGIGPSGQQITNPLVYLGEVSTAGQPTGMGIQFNVPYVFDKVNAITSSSAVFNYSNETVIDDFFHEFGHDLTPELVQAADDAGNFYNHVVALYGPSSQEATTAGLDLVAAENAAEEGANLYGAIISGINSLQNQGTFQQGVQSFVDGYLGTTNPAGDFQHGTVFDQFVAITQALPGITVTMPNNLVQYMGLGADDAPGTTYSVDENGVVIQHFPLGTSSATEKIDEAAAQTTYNNAANTDQVDNEEDKAGTDDAAYQVTDFVSSISTGGTTFLLATTGGGITDVRVADPTLGRWAFAESSIHISDGKTVEEGDGSGGGFEGDGGFGDGAGDGGGGDGAGGDGDGDGDGGGCEIVGGKLTPNC